MLLGPRVDSVGGADERRPNDHEARPDRTRLVGWCRDGRIRTADLLVPNEAR